MSVESVVIKGFIMKILSPIQRISSNQTLNNNQTSPVFASRVKLDKDIFEKVSEGIFNELKDGSGKGEFAEKIKTQFSDPDKRKVFFGVIASLVTSAAVQITELLTDNHLLLSSNETPADKIKKHKGRQADFEINLVDTIRDKINELKLEESYSDGAYKLYNKFCGVNYKGQHYSTEGKLFVNKAIVQNLCADLAKCSDSEQFKRIVELYEKSYLSEKEYAESTAAKEAKIFENIDSESLNILQSYKNIKNSYIEIANTDDKNSKKQNAVKAFIGSINKEIQDENIKKLLFSRINRNYSDVLYEISDIYNELKNQDDDSAQQFVTDITNKMISMDALKKWDKSGCRQRLDFNTYNSLIYSGVSDESIKSLSKLKRDTKIKEFEILTPEIFKVKLPYPAFSKNFNLINNLFFYINDGKYEPLLSDDSSSYTTKDIEAELYKHSDTYPYLEEFLSDMNGNIYNTKKMQHLINLYYGNENNKNIFTLHSYLRFMERVVLPDVKEYGEENDIHSSRAVGSEFINKLNELKQALNREFKSPVEINKYSVENIQAPQLIVDLANCKQDCFNITLNKDNKIHTIY